MNFAQRTNALVWSGLAALACPACDSESDEETTEATASATDGGTSSAGTSGGESSSGASGSSTTDPSAGTTTGASDGVCEAFANKSVECVPEAVYEDELEFCTDTLEVLGAQSAECVAAWEALLTCAIGVDCDAFNAEQTPKACQSLSAEFEATCEIGGGTTTGGSADTGGSTSGG